MLDKTDTKLLLALLENSRTPITQLAKKNNISRDVATYRIDRLKKNGIIRDFTTEIDVAKLNHISALFFVTIHANVEQEFINYINKLNYISWAGTIFGQWSLGMAIYGKNTQEVEERFQKIYQQYKGYITNHTFAFYKTTELFHEKFLGGTRKPTEQKKRKHRLDSHDKIILKRLSKNARVTSAELAKEIGLSIPAITQRIRKLEASGYILKYTAFLNVLKLKLYQFVFFIENKNLEHRQQLYNYLFAHPKVSLLLDYIGDPFIEFSIFVDDPYKARAILQEIRETFPNNKLVDHFFTQEEFISFGLPECVFE